MHNEKYYETLWRVEIDCFYRNHTNARRRQRRRACDASSQCADASAEIDATSGALGHEIVQHGDGPAALIIQKSQGCQEENSPVHGFTEEKSKHCGERAATEIKTFFTWSGEKEKRDIISWHLLRMIFKYTTYGIYVAMMIIQCFAVLCCTKVVKKDSIQNLLYCCLGTICT